MESKYNGKIKEMMDTHNNVISESNGKVKRLEAELKQLHEKYHIESRGKMNEQGSLEKRMQDLQENERRLQ